MNPIRSIHVGVGFRGRWPINLMPRAGWQPVAIVDPNEELAEEARALLGLDRARVFRDLEHCIASVEADAVIICAPTAFHAPLSKIAFDAGLAVLVEKGMTYDLASAVDLVRRAEDRNVPFCVVQNHRFMESPRILLREAERGTFGRTAHAELLHHRYRPDPRTFTYPYATVWDMGVHHFDTLIALLGRPVRVDARSFSAPWSAYPHHAGVAALLEFEDGSHVNYLLSLVAHHDDFRFRLHTEAGTVDSPYDRGAVTLRRAGTDEVQRFEAEANAPTSDEGVLDTFAAYLRGGDPPGIAGRANLQTMATCQAVADSAESGRPVDVQELLARTLEEVAA